MEFPTVDDLLKYFKTNPKRRPTTTSEAATGTRQIPMSQYGARPGTSYGLQPALRTVQMAGHATPFGAKAGYGVQGVAAVVGGLAQEYPGAGYGVVPGFATPGYLGGS